MDVALGFLEGLEIRLGGWNFGPKLCTGGGIFVHNFYNLKNSGQDLSNEGSKLFLSLLEVGH